MSFAELDFWGFFAIVVALYLILPHRGQNRMLLVASYAFYAAWDWRFLGLILLSTGVDYIVGLRMARAHDPVARARLLTVSLVVNLGMLGIFKYLGFFADSFAALAASLGWDPGPVTLGIVLPVGISFYTFQTLSYTIDIWRRDLEPTTDFLDFALFVAFFPQLVAGPIERASNLLPNIAAPRILSWDQAGRGAVLCLLGLIKKVVVADGVAPSVDAIYGAPDPSGLDVVFATWLFAVQIYGDFSGYTDIARGVALILGFRLMRNFAQPYFAVNPQEFWRRWHISLSTWLRDYLYVSLGGNRGGPRRTQVNLMATMLLGGLWHGAAWNFVLWGAFQGGLLAAHRALVGRRAGSGEGVVAGGGSVTIGGAPKGDPSRRTLPARPALRLLWRLVRAAVFFQIVCYGWLLFRADSFAQIVDFTGRIASLGALGPAALSLPDPPFSAFLGILFVIMWDILVEWRANPAFYATWPPVVRAGLWACMIYLLAFGATTSSSAFIYFQF